MYDFETTQYSILKINVQPYLNSTFLFVCLFAWVFFSSHSRIFHSYGKSQLPVKGFRFDLYSTFMAIEQWGFISMPHLLWHGSSVKNDHLRKPRDTHTSCRAFSCGAVTTSFYDLGLSRLGLKHPTFRLRGERTNSMRHRRGLNTTLRFFNLLKSKVTWKIYKKWYLCYSV